VDTIQPFEINDSKNITEAEIDSKHSSSFFKRIVQAAEVFDLKKIARASLAFLLAS
jgi:hypothetical protein